MCDLALTILLAKTVNFEMKDTLTEIKISALFFKKIDDPLFSNEKCYLPQELQYHVSLTIYIAVTREPRQVLRAYFSVAEYVMKYYA